MDTLALPNMSIVTVLVWYLFTQTIMAGIIYYLISNAAKRKIHMLFGDAGREAFFVGFNEAAREAITGLIQDTHAQAMKTAELAVAAAQDLAVKTTADADAVSEKLHTIDRQLYELRLTFDKIDQMSEDMHDTNRAISDLQARLLTFFEQKDGNKP